MRGRLEITCSCALLGGLLGGCSAPEVHRRQLQAAEPEPLSERCSARVEEFGAFADAEGAEWSAFRLYVDHNDGAVFGDEGEANVYELSARRAGRSSCRRPIRSAQAVRREHWRR